MTSQAKWTNQKRANDVISWAPHLPLGRQRVHTSVLTRSDDFATMTTMIGGPTVSSTTPAAVPMYKPPPVTHAPQGQPVTPSSQGQQMTPAPLQG